jgi:hypothetical protein
MTRRTPRKVCNAEYSSTKTWELEIAECTEPPSWAELWDTPRGTREDGQKDGSWPPSGCACAFVPGCIVGFCFLWGQLHVLSSVRQDLESKLRENQQLQTAAQICPTLHSAPVDVESPAEHEAEEGTPPK